MCSIYRTLKVRFSDRAQIAYVPTLPLKLARFERLGVVKYIIQVRQNLCMVENPVGKTYSHARKATG